MLSILRPEFLEEPIECDDPVPGTLCYFDTLPERICPFVIMDIANGLDDPRKERVRDEYHYDDLEKCPVLTYGYPPELLFFVIPDRRWRQFGMNRDTDDYEIIWPDDTVGLVYIRLARSVGLPVEYVAGRKVHGRDWID